MSCTELFVLDVAGLPAGHKPRVVTAQGTGETSALTWWGFGIPLPHSPNPFCCSPTRVLVPVPREMEGVCS